VVIDGGASFEAISGDPLQYAGEIPVALSFHATKSFGTGEGGCVITTDRQCAERLGQALNFGFLASRTCEIASTNGKMSEYHAAVGLAELDGWADKAAALRALAREYRQQLDVRRLAHRFVAVPDVASCYALFRCTDDAEVTRVLDSLDASNIDSRHWYGHGLHRHPYYAASPRDRLTVTDGLAPLTIGLPVAPDLPAASVARVVAALARAIGDR
jgi:dTDP-4-amino-4,6-dideoxygalactose transaminase